jgi:hypothetical protein
VGNILGFILFTTKPVIHPHVYGEYTYQVGFLLANFVIHPHRCGEYFMPDNASTNFLRFTPTSVGNILQYNFGF